MEKDLKICRHIVDADVLGDLYDFETGEFFERRKNNAWRVFYAGAPSQHQLNTVKTRQSKKGIKVYGKHCKVGGKNCASNFTFTLSQPFESIDDKYDFELSVTREADCNCGLGESAIEPKPAKLLKSKGPKTPASSLNETDVKTTGDEAADETLIDLDEVDDVPDRFIDKARFLKRFSKFVPPPKALIARRLILLNKPFTRFTQPSNSISSITDTAKEAKNHVVEQKQDESHEDDLPGIESEGGKQDDELNTSRKRFLEDFEDSFRPVDAAEKAADQQPKSKKAKSGIIKKKTYIRLARPKPGSFKAMY